MSLLIVLGFIVLLVVQARSQQEREQKAYQRGYEDARRQLDIQTEANADSKVPTVQTDDAKLNIHQSSQAASTQSIADKQKVKSQTLNITLYAASLLLVAGLVLFTETVVDSQLALLVMAWLILAAYYVTGLTLYVAAKQLKPVSVAFVGTALAGLPFVGMLLATTLDMTGSSAWLVTSLIGLAAYGYAAIKLRSQVLGYAVTAVMISCGLSLMSVLGAGIVWFFVMTLMLAVVMRLVISQLPAESKLDHLVEPLTVVGRWLPLASLLMSLVLANQLVALDYSIIWTVAGLYYFGRAIDSKDDRDSRNENWIMTRLVLSIAALFCSYALTQDAHLLTITAAIVGMLQVGLSIYFMRKPGWDAWHLQNEVSLWSGLGLILLAPALLMFGSSDTELAQLVTLVTLSLAVLTSLVAVWLLKRIELGYVSTAALLFLPGLAVYYFAVEPTASAYAWCYLEVVLIATAVRIWRDKSAKQSERLFFHLTIGPTALLALLALLSAPAIAVQIAGLSVLAVVYYLLAWCDRQPWIVLAGNLMLVAVMRAVYETIGLSAMEIVGLIALSSTVLFASTYIVFNSLGEQFKTLAKVFLISAAISGIFLGTFSVASTGGYASLAMLAMMISGSLMIANRQQFGGASGLMIGAAVLTVAMQRLFAMTVPDVSMLFYAHWWAVVLWLLGYLEYKSGNQRHAVAYGYTGLGLVSLFGLGYALDGDSLWYQALFIIEHSLLLLVGLMKSWRQVTVWGALGVTLAVLWMFRGFTSLFLTLIGIIIILVVIWVVRRESHK